jgi:hypothetical protein
VAGEDCPAVGVFSGVEEDSPFAEWAVEVGAHGCIS